LGGSGQKGRRMAGDQSRIENFHKGVFEWMKDELETSGRKTTKPTIWQIHVPLFGATVLAARSKMSFERGKSLQSGVVREKKKGGGKSQKAFRRRVEFGRKEENCLTKGWTGKGYEEPVWIRRSPWPP